MRHRQFASLSLACLFLSLLGAIPGWSGEGWQSLFNGKNLDGWRANNDPESFVVKDRVLRIQASGKTAAHLFYVGDRKDGVVPFKNFELEATVRAEPNSNSGIYFHSDMTTRDAFKHLAKGCEVQLNSSRGEKRKTGSLYGIVDLDESPVDETQWFKVRLSVRDNRVQIAINDKECVDYTQPENPKRTSRILSPTGGGIALQAHDSRSIWYFKEIRIRTLP